MESSFFTSGEMWPQQNPIQPSMPPQSGFHRKSQFQRFPQKKQPSQPQIVYCEICRISCAGPQPYKDHVAGQKHRKKEATLALQQKIDSGSKTSSKTVLANASRLYCGICDVACGSADTYSAHVRGIKHQRAVSLHALIGKQIPDSAAENLLPPGDKSDQDSFDPISGLVATQTLKSAKHGDGAMPETKLEPVDSVDGSTDASTKEGEFIGLEFIEEVQNERGLIVSYNCRLCECSFTDPNAKRVHLKGRRHRVQYKKKIDSSLKVETKPSSRTQKVREERARKQLAKESYWRQQDFLLGMWLEKNQSSGDFEKWSHVRKTTDRWPKTPDDHYMINKHLDLYPSSEEMTEIHDSILSFENALKLVSDIIATEDTPIEISDCVKPTDALKIEAASVITVKDDLEQATDSAEEMSKGQEPVENVDGETCRELKGAMRVGYLSKGLLLRGDVVEHIVIICAGKPTRSLLQRILDHLPDQLAAVSEKSFSVEARFEESGLLVKIFEPAAAFAVTLTSISDLENAECEPDDLLSEEHCMSALTQLRRTKWYQMRLSTLKVGTMVTHVLRDLCRRITAFKPLTEWVQELLVEKCVFVAGLDIGPGQALRTLFECISSGILLPGGPGLMDPCEKTPTDVAAGLTGQQREDITASAQHFLRMLVCRQMYKILDMEPYQRKRRNDSQDGGTVESGPELKKVRKHEAESESADGNSVESSGKKLSK